MPFFVYILQSEKDGTFYKGFSTDCLRRLLYHNAGKSRYTKSRTPWRLVYAEELSSKQEALIRERQLKSANSEYIGWLIGHDSNLITEG